MAKKSNNGQEDDIFDLISVTTKAGQVGNRFRYYILFTTISDKKLTDYDKEIIEYTVKEVDKKYKSKSESVSFGDGTYVLIHWLIPDNIAEQSVCDLFLDVASSKFNILNYHFNSSNVDDFTKNDIINYKKFLRGIKNETAD